MSVAAGEVGMKAHHQPSQAVDIGLRQHEVGGAVVVPHLEGRQAAVGVVGGHRGIVLAVVFEHTPPSQGLFEAFTVGHLNQRG